ncbi:MAG: hypothetical protein HY901_28715, partial [Deltaproteobacteria bacterium]|nr:hypothetical protein [Deltaproteobacteria bacterium]
MNRCCFRALLTVFALLAPSVALGGPFPPHLVQLKNPDGATFAARLLGDEFYLFAEDARGYTLVLDQASKAWHYARLTSEGRLVPMRERPGTKVDPGRLGIVRHLRPGKADLQLVAERRTKVRPTSHALVPPQGNVRMLVILAKFNCPIPAPVGAECLTSTAAPRFQPAQFSPVLNGPFPSVADYYRVNSGGALNFQIDIAKDDWIPLQHN